ncbi:hypothetical protein OEZ86_011754 [Tetradesmus obliquus]|nr:hypothetical protein OEZ86_011754 [Tetradesmus obliquus]
MLQRCQACADDVAVECHKLQLAAADSAAYCCRLAEIQSAVGLATMGLMLGSRLIFKYLGWAGAALISPLSLLLPGAAFFSCSLLANLFTPCKQMVYKTLPQQQQAESKAAVDLVGGQFANACPSTSCTYQHAHRRRCAW